MWRRRAANWARPSINAAMTTLRSHTVGKAAGTGEQSVHFIGAQMDLEPAGIECLGDPIKSRRQIDGELGEVDAELLQTLFHLGGSHP